jgi:hypothetical protein
MTLEKNIIGDLRDQIFYAAVIIVDPVVVFFSDEGDQRQLGPTRDWLTGFKAEAIFHSSYSEHPESDTFSTFFICAFRHSKFHPLV